MGCCQKSAQTTGKNLTESQTQTDDQNMGDQLIDGRLTTVSNLNSAKKQNGIEIENINNQDNNDIKTDTMNENKMQYEIILKDFLNEEIDNTNVFPDNWYRDDEKSKIIYSKRSIVAMLDQAFAKDNTEYKEIYNKFPFVLNIKSEGSFINDNFQVVKSVYTAPKNTLPPKVNIQTLAYYLIFIDKRKQWDSQLKEYKCIEGIETNGIMYNRIKAPIILVSERDIAEKRVDFMYNGSYYLFESSVNDEIFPVEDGVVRLVDIIFFTQIYEDEENFYIRSLSQMDAKVSIPQMIVNVSLPNTLQNYYINGIKALKEDSEKGKLELKDSDFIK